MSSTLERVSADSYLGVLTDAPIEEVRAKRAECQEVETGLSYLRRLIQGRLDLLAGEAERRRSGDESSSDLVGRLTSILADRTRTPGLGRLPHSLGTGEVDPELEAEVDAALSPGAELGELSDDELASAAERLADVEARVSAHRKVLFERLDELQAEIGRRYRTGEADVESLLP